MRRVMERLEERTRVFALEPFFTFLGSASVDARQRLAFAPFAAHFVMSFADLYAFVLKEEPAKDRYQELVNAHASEDEEHWRWFLADLDKIGSDPRVTFTQALRFVWGDATVQTRMLSYQMCKFGLRADSLTKLVLVHCIEAAGKVTVDRVAAVGREFSKSTGKRLVYLGPHHSETEGQHTLEETNTRQSIADIVLDDAVARTFTTMVDVSFDAFTGFIREMFACASAGRSITGS